MKRDTAILITLLVLVPCLCFWEVFDGQLLLPTDWVYRDLEPWKRTNEVTEIANSRIKDAVLDGYALDVVSARGAAEGRVVLWNRYAGGGVPHLAGGFSRMLYPPFWVYAIAEPETARNVEILLHLFLAEIFAFLFLRRVGVGLAGAWFGALAFAFTPSLVHRAEIPFIFPSLVWFPFLLYCIEGVVATGKPRWVAGLSVAVGFQILAGHFPDIFLHFAGAGLYGLVRLAQLQTVKGGSVRVGVKRLALCLAGVAIGASLAAPFLLPALELIQQANRPTTPLDELVASGLAIKDVAGSLVSPWVNRSQLYIGLVALVFVPAAFGRDRRAAAWGLAATAMAGIAIATGSPVLVLLHEWVPGFENLKYVRTHISLAAFSLALLSGIGVSRFVDRRTNLPLYLACVAVAGLVAAWGLGSDVLSSLLRIPGSVGVAFVLLVSSVLYRQRRLSRTLYTVVLTCALLAELFSYARKYNPRTDPDVLPMFPEFSSIAFLDDDRDRFRVASLLGNYETPFWPNTLGAYGIEDVAAYHSLLPGQVGRYMARVNRYTAGANPRVVVGEDAAGNWLSLNRFRPTTLVRLWNIKYFVMPEAAPNPDPEWLELAYDGEVRLFRDRSWLPRVWLADGALVLPNESGISSKLLDSRFDPLETVLLREEPLCGFGVAAGSPVAPNTEPTVEIVTHEAERIVVRTRSPRFNFLVLSETFYPGWVAHVDGSRAPILNANLNFRAVGLGPGEHEVTLTYRPASFRWGVTTAVVSIAVLLLTTFLSGNVAWVLVLSLVPVLVGAAGWQLASQDSAERSCGQLQISRRLLDGEATTYLTLRNATLAASSHAERSWSSPESGPALVDFRVAPGDTGATLSTDSEPLLSVAHESTQPRWIFHRAVIPDSAEEISLTTTPSTTIGGALMFTPGPRRQSRAVFLNPDERIEDVSLEPETALRVLVMRDSSSPTPEGFDIVYESARDARFTDRLLAVAADLYRFETLVVVQPELEDGDGAFTLRQRQLFERELERLGIRDNVVIN